MATLYRYRTSLTGFPGGPGVSTLYFLDQQTALASVRAFWASMAAVMPLNVVIQAENTGDIIESTTGALTGTWTKDPVAPSLGTQAGNYSAPSGLTVAWLTNGIVNRRRLRGRTFVVPIGATAYAPDGTIANDTLTFIRNAAAALIFEQSLSFVVWARPVAARAATATSPAIAGRAGSHSLVTATRVPDKAAVLRSRRD